MLLVPPVPPKCGQQTSTLGITWELVGKADFSGPTAGQPNQSLQQGPAVCYFNKLSRELWCTVKFENHCPRLVLLKASYTPKSPMNLVRNSDSQGTWLAPSVERVTLDLRVVRLGSTMGIEPTLKNN